MVLSNPSERPILGIHSSLFFASSMHGLLNLGSSTGNRNIQFYTWLILCLINVAKSKIVTCSFPRLTGPEKVLSINLIRLHHIINITKRSSLFAISIYSVFFLNIDL